VLRYALFRQGMLAMTGAPIRAFVCSGEGLEAPDLMLGWIPMRPIVESDALFADQPAGARMARAAMNRRPSTRGLP
jgi:hypothetical protein